MPKVLGFIDHGRRGRWAVVGMDDGDPCWISIAQAGILVKKSRSGLFGAKLYEETNVYRAAETARALDALYPRKLTPSSMSDPVLVALVNAILHCQNLAEATRVLNQAVEMESSHGHEDAVPSDDPSKAFHRALVELESQVLSGTGLASSANITDATGSVLTHITSVALTESGEPALPSSLSTAAASVGASFMAACLAAISVRVKDPEAVLDEKKAPVTRMTFAMSFLLDDRVRIISEGVKTYQAIVAQATARANLKEWLDSLQSLIDLYVLTGDRKWLSLLAKHYGSLAAARE